MLPTFAQAESQAHLDRLAHATNRSADALLALIDDLDGLTAQALNRSGTPRLQYGSLTGRPRLGSRP